MNLEWSAAALADLDRFALFLHDRNPRLAAIVGAEILMKAQILMEHPKLGRPIQGRIDFREVMLRVLNATYVFRYAYDGERLVMLRVFHGREARE
ncbi:MAG: type II toxin-antitoxin system RelE/ParE family toxin [Methylobacteriaceae bacterium]|nr:type II toxin-antitoxin system RelE/ParE family toxin [Methylobacteriaceae bacterium]MBV9219699.1 type II toxin-antitoxin system RelE/ParE family toxin [Methylobacteriaceae bacterium]MBV9636758.1 type II toxin-antitoxin system RelE/ParE family toxin [Methylobacteriaceae bacterium]MBV9701529.1 type II toxin-antitoxin system RelE/ParE family toxin [Methylobacteriaceae bacterium]